MPAVLNDLPQWESGGKNHLTPEHPVLGATLDQDNTGDMDDRWAWAHALLKKRTRKNDLCQAEPFKIETD